MQARSETVLQILEGVSTDISESVRNLLPTLPERKGQMIFLLQNGFKIFNAILRLLCETDPNIKDWNYENILQSFVDFSINKIKDSGVDENPQNEVSEDAEDEDSEDASDDASEDEDSEEVSDASEDDAESIDDKLNKMSLSDLAPILEEFFSMFEINNLSFALFLNGEIEFFPSETHDSNNIFCISKDGEEINPLYFQESERRLIFRFLLER